MIVVKVRDREIRIAPTAPVTSGSVGLPVTWTFSEEWEGLTKTAVFRGSDTARDVVLTEDVCVVPADVLTESDGPLEIGVRGVRVEHDEDTDEDVVTVAIPTIWGRIDRIYDGTIPSEADPSAPEPDWTEQVKAAATAALSKATAVEAAAARGDFDGASAYEQAVAGGYTGTEAQFNEELSSFSDLSEQAASSATGAATSATAAAGSATDAATSASSASGSATAAAGSATGAASSASSASSSATAAANSATAAANSATAAAGSASTAAASATAAAESATAAAGSETAAASSASSAASSATAAAASAAAIEEYEHDAEAWAIGKRGGSDVGSTDDTYHNNSKYYAEQAAASSTTASSAAAAASQSETNAEASKTAAAGSASTATTAASTAEGHATNAASSATAASGSATDAAGSATAAGAAQTAAETAQTAAEAAQTAAETAQDAAEDAQAAAEAVLASIPADYSDLAEDVEDLQSAFNAAIVPTTNLITLINLQTGKIVNASGAIVDNTQYSLSDFIPVEPSTQYYAKGLIYFAQYNAEKTFIVRTNAVSAGGLITTRANTAYIRVMSNKPVSVWQLNQGDADLGYQEPDAQYLGKDVIIGKQLEATTFGLDLVTPKYNVPFIPSMPYHYTGDSITPYKNGGHLAELYALYDELVATYPQYCCKSVLGLDASGNYELRRYTIDNGTNYAYRYPRLVWLAGIHGNEGNSITTTYHMAKELLSKFATDPSCFGILSYYRIIIVPVVNPWGFENYSRVNSNNVNLNRNFPADWIYRDPSLAYGETKYGITSASNGSSPYYYYGGGTVVYDDSTQTSTTTYVAEPETQLIMDMINSNNTGANLNGKIAFAVNKHDAGPMSQEGATILIRDNFTYDREFLTDLCMWLKTQLMATQNWLTEKTGLNLSTVWYELANDPASAGTMDKWLNAIGIHGCLLEIPKEAGSSYADTEHYADLCTINVDVGINLMMNTIVNNSKLKIATQTEKYTIVT